MRSFYSNSCSSRKYIRMIASFNAQPSMLTGFGKPVSFQNANPGETSVTTLSNGTRVITHDVDGPCTAIGLYVKAGAAYDPTNLPGVNYALRWCFLSSNMENSQFQIDKSFRSVGASYEHTELRKKLLGFKIESDRESWKEPFSHMLSCVSVPRFPQSELLKVQDCMENATEEQRWKSPREWCIEQIEQIAFKGEPLGNPRHITPYFVDELTTDKLQEQWSRTFTPNRITIAGVNVSHNELVMLCESQPYGQNSSSAHFKELTDDTEAREKEMYHGGYELELPEKREKEMSTKPFMENETVGALAWKSFGGNDLRSFATSMVLQQLLAVSLQEGKSIQTGTVDHGIRSFYVPFATVGLLGMTIREKPSDAAGALKSALGLHRELKKQIASQSVVSAAKHRAKLRLYHDHIELRRDYIDFLALHQTGDPKVSPYHAILSEIEKVDEAALKMNFEYTDSAAPCMYTMGDVFGVPSLRQLGIQRTFEAKKISS